MTTQVASEVALSQKLMADFAVGTGLDGPEPQRRYLWTDAFAVCNYLGFYRASGEGRYLELALRLVDQVHHVLGRYRSDDPRKGWISGLPEEEGERRPTAGGLRIGKPLPERRPDEIYDPRLEWERDGQYFHYLTQWMHALVRVSEETGQELFLEWALELAKSAHRAFASSEALAACPLSSRMAWKMSTALDRVLVPCTGQHDPLDAWVSYQEVGLTASAKRSSSEVLPLASEIDEVGEICRHLSWVTNDALGAGSMLLAAHKLARLMLRYGISDEGMLEQIIEVAAVSVAAVAANRFQEAGAESRLAFRELGLAIGLHAFDQMRGAIAGHPGFPVDGMLSTLAYHVALGGAIDRFWSKPVHRDNHAWREDADINGVMLATSLAPEGYLGPG